MSQLQRRSAERALAVEQTKAERNLAVAQSVISQDYLSQLEQYPVLKPELESEEGFHLGGDVRIFRISRLVQENRQAVLESATAAYAALGEAKSSVFFYLHSTGMETSLFIGVRGPSGSVMGQRNGDLLKEVFRGHFPGSKLEAQEGEAVRNISSDLCGMGTMEEQGSVTAVSGVPGLASEDRSLFIQGLEHFIDSAENKAYQALILADPVTPEDLMAIRAGCERLASRISPLAKTTIAYNQSESYSVAKSLTASVNESFSDTKTTGTSHTDNEGGSRSVTTESRGRSVARGGLKTAGVLGGAAAALWMPGIDIAAKGALEVAGALGIGDALASLIPKKDITEGTNWGTSHGTNESASSGRTHGTSRSDGETKTTGDNQGITRTIEQQNKTVEQFLGMIDYRLERIAEARSYGGWSAAAYFIAETPAVSESLASTYMGLMRGVASGQDAHAITTWSGEQAALPRKWLSSFHHPRMDAKVLAGPDQAATGWVTPAVMLSSREVAMLLNLPRRSASTLPVLEAEPFGRSIQGMNGTMPALSRLPRGDRGRHIQLGCIRHLWEDLPQKIIFDREQLKTHAFIAGTTGSGKSNTLYLVLHQLLEAGIPFLVVEPAKGEYARVFGGYEQVHCFDAGTGRAEGLKIDPFRCPGSLHLLEHIDRLADIFCLCWPLYAAMPAILKDAVVVAYERAGWDVETSTYIGSGKPSYPDFTALLSALEDVIASAGYGERLQAEYTGALCTRVRSLTTGLNGQIFTSRETGDEILFDRSAIVDLSRIGSAETRSLIMGILVMRLVEYRQAQGEMNAPLRHVTVLEEAHNLLRANAAQGSGEQGSMTGKSVEMLTDAIAEMRTYGEGFIIVDQSPQAVHPAAIRNTGTKVALRLPDEEDRRVLGASIGLREEQIREMARLENGVAVVQQSGWLEPVLCHMSRFDEETLAQPLKATQKVRLDGSQLRRLRSDIVDFLLQPAIGSKNPMDATSLRIRLSQWPDEAERQKLLYYIDLCKTSGRVPLSMVSSEDEYAVLAKFVTDLSGLRRQVALLAGKKQSVGGLDAELSQLVRKRLKSFEPAIYRALGDMVLADWAGLGNAQRQSRLMEWREYRDRGSRSAGTEGAVV